jgi:predicted aspartyl protease
VERAEALFKKGHFAEAEAIYAALAAGKSSADYTVVLNLGRLALISNRLKQAQQWLEKAVQSQANSKEAKSLLAEALCRQDNYGGAASLLRATGDEATAKQFETVGQAPAFRIEGNAPSTSLKFVMTDPLPLVRVRINGIREVNFLIDTGAAQVVLDPDFAKEVGVQSFGARTGTFAGGKRASVQLGRIDSIALGDFTVRNIPVALLNTRRFSGRIFGGKPVDGIIGTVLLYHFLSTLDYPNHQLILRRKTDDHLAVLEKNEKEGKSIAVPFWMAGDHEMVAWGKIENSEPILLLVDTGLAGGGVTLTKSVIDSVGIKLHENQASEGIGGGGKVRVVPFQVKEMSLGPVNARNVTGLFAGPFPLENSLGFRLGGIVSHGFFRSYALTFDFDKMRLILEKKG